VSGSPPVGAGHLGDALSALLDGELEPATEEAARAHLAGCPACGAEQAAVAQARRWVRSLPPVEPPARFYGRMLGDRPAGTAHRRRAGTAAHRRRAGTAAHRRRAGVAAFAACAAASAVLLGVTSPSDPSTSPPVGRFIEAHATAVGGGDPVSHLVTVGVPVSFGR
jgi:anti-sigma factor RsiW